MTDEELTKLYEEAGLDAKFYLAQRDRAKAYEKQYYLDHAVCPECGDPRHSSTYLGFIVNPEHPETYKDTNRVKCANCGWGGTTHDLVKAT